MIGLVRLHVASACCYQLARVALSPRSSVSSVWQRVRRLPKSLRLPPTNARCPCHSTRQRMTMTAASGQGTGGGSRGQLCMLSEELPLGAETIRRPSGIIIIAELVSGAFVWILVASTRLRGTEMHQGWVMFVSVTFCALSIIQLVLYLTGTAKQGSTWIHLDLALSLLAFTLYLSAAVLQVNTTVIMLNAYISECSGGSGGNTALKEAILYWYRINVAATVFAFLTTGLYAISAFISIQRWKMT